MMTITLENDEGLEEEFQLPSKFEVCPRCEGAGTHLHPAIGQHAYSVEEFEESFDDEERQAYFHRGGMYDVQCEQCKGLRVMEVPNEEVIQRDPKLAVILKRYQDHEANIAQMNREDAHTRWMEDGCPE